VTVSSSDLEVRWITGRAVLDTHEQLLRSVAQSAAHPSPFAQPEFLRSYTDHFEYSCDAPVPEIAVAYLGSAAVGFLATRVDTREVASKISISERVLLVTHDHDRLNVVAHQGIESPVALAFARALLERSGASAIDIGGLSVGSPLHRALHFLGSSSPRWAVSDFPLPSYATVPVAYESMAGYFAALSKTMRSNVSRQTRRLYAAGDTRLLFANGPSAVSSVFPAMLELEQRSWKFPAEVGMLRNPKRTDFFTKVVEGEAAYQPSLIGIVLDGKLIGSLLLGSYANRMWALEMSFDESYSDVGPGQLLLLLAMHSAIEHGVSSIGFLQHFAYFKKRWLAEHEEVVSTRLVRVGSPLHIRRVGANVVARIRPSSSNAQDADEWNEERRKALGQPVHRFDGQHRWSSALPVSGDGIAWVSHADAGGFLPFKLH
jgi:hypothetical protein